MRKMKRIMILIACMAGFFLQGIAQHEAIDKRIDSILNDKFYNYTGYEDMNIFKQDLVYSVEKLHQHINDTTPKAKNKILLVTKMIFNYIDSSSYDVIFQYNLLYARDSTIKENYYDLIVAIIRNTVLQGINPPPSVIQFIGSPEFYKATTWKLPLLISYLDMYGEIENLKKWGKMHSLNEHTKNKLMIALLRLGDNATTKEYIKMSPTNGSEWDNYITGLGYARTKATTEHIIKLLDNKTKIEYYGYARSYDPNTYYSTVSSLALERLSQMIEDFPFGRMKVSYMGNYFLEIPADEVKKVKRWFKDNPDYKIIRKSNYNY